MLSAWFTWSITFLQLVIAYYSEAKSNFSYAECLALERLPLTLSPTGRNFAKVVSVKEHSPAYLHCPLPAPSFLVALTRLSDDALLAVGDKSFTQDLRFQVSAPRRERNDWVLIIRRAQLSDQGCYLCEINTEPASLVPVFLKVSPLPAANNQEIDRYNTGALPGIQKRNSRLHTKIEGRSLLLNCTVEREASNAGAERDIQLQRGVVWSKNDRPLDLLDERRYLTDYQVADEGMIVYTLRIRDVSPALDDGVYACESDRQTRATQIVSLNYLGSSANNRLRPFCYLTMLALSITRIFSILFNLF